MKVVNAMFGCGLGGIEQALVDYCEALRLRGHEPVAIVHPEAEVRTALKLRAIPFYTLSNAGAWDPIAIFRLKGLIERIAPDVCIAHGNRAVSLLSRAVPKRRIVGAMHNYKINFGKLRFVFYPTQDLLHHVNKGEMEGKELYHVPNLVRLPEEIPERKWRDPPVIGAMGRFVAKKGFDLFIESLAVLKTRDIAFRAVIAGDGEEAEALKKLAAEKGLSDQLEFLGWAGDKQAFFDAIDLFCMPSHHEPFGIVLLEAMAQGLPVVATRSEGPSEIIHDGKDGVLVDKADPVLLADALTDMLAVPPRAQVLALGGYNTAKTYYDLPVVADKLDLALRALCRV